MGKINLPHQELLYSYGDHNCEVLVEGQTHRSIEQNRKPNKDPYRYAQLIFNKDTKVI